MLINGHDVLIPRHISVIVGPINNAFLYSFTNEHNSEGALFLDVDSIRKLGSQDSKLVQMLVYQCSTLLGMSGHSCRRLLPLYLQAMVMVVLVAVLTLNMAGSES